MNEEEFKNFVDPMAGGVEPPTQDSALVAQVRDLRRQLDEQPLRVQLEVVDPKELDADGVFGYANRIKTVIGQLIAAEERGPPLLAQAQAARDQAAQTTPLPTGLEPAAAFGGVDALLQSARNEQEERRYLLVQSHAEAAIALLERLVGVLPLVAATVAEHHARERDIQAILDGGYRLPTLDAARGEAERLIQTAYGHIQAGEIDQTRAAVQTITTHSEAMLAAARERVALRAKNIAELERLSAEVARVERMRVADAVPALTALQTYPDTNWRDIEGYVSTAAATLGRTFDDPANPDDLHSSVERQNSMDVQEFDAAEQALTEAFAAVAEAEQQSSAVVARLAEVREIERAAPTIEREVAAALATATERRDRDDRKIDQAVDTKLRDAAEALEEGRRALAARSFVAASAALNRSRSLSAAAQASADEQSLAIDALYAQLARCKAAATQNVALAQAELRALPAAAHKQETTRMVVVAQAKLREAETVEATLAANEDHQLADALRVAAAAYEAASADAEGARQQIKADQEDYQRVIADRQKAIAAAQSALDSANGYVRHVDAGGRGGDALRQGFDVLPTLPPYGATLDAYVRLAAQALRAQQFAEAARIAAQRRMQEVEAERAAERRRREEAERRRRAEQEAHWRRFEESRRASERARSSSSWGSSSRSSRSSSFGSSSRSSRSSSMGSSRRR
jgi:hypothetical protein